MQMEKEILRLNDQMCETIIAPLDQTKLQEQEDEMIIDVTFDEVEEHNRIKYKKEDKKNKRKNRKRKTEIVLEPLDLTRAIQEEENWIESYATELQQVITPRTTPIKTPRTTPIRTPRKSIREQYSPMENGGNIIMTREQQLQRVQQMTARSMDENTKSDIEDDNISTLTETRYCIREKSKKKKKRRSRKTQPIKQVVQTQLKRAKKKSGKSGKRKKKKLTGSLYTQRKIKLNVYDYIVVPKTKSIQKGKAKQLYEKLYQDGKKIKTKKAETREANERVTKRNYTSFTQHQKNKYYGEIWGRTTPHQYEYIPKKECKIHAYGTHHTICTEVSPVTAVMNATGPQNDYVPVSQSTQNYHGLMIDNWNKIDGQIYPTTSIGAASMNYTGPQNDYVPVSQSTQNYHGLMLDNWTQIDAKVYPTTSIGAASMNYTGPQNDYVPVSQSTQNYHGLMIDNWNKIDRKIYATTSIGAASMNYTGPQNDYVPVSQSTQNYHACSLAVHERYHRYMQGSQLGAASLKFTGPMQNYIPPSCTADIGPGAYSYVAQHVLSQPIWQRSSLPSMQHA